MNFVFISLHFLHIYWNFCQRLKQNGVTVLVLPMRRMRVCHKEKSEMKKYYAEGQVPTARPLSSRAAPWAASTPATSSSAVPTSSTRCWHQTGITSFKIEFVRQPQCCLIYLAPSSQTTSPCLPAPLACTTRSRYSRRRGGRWCIPGSGGC